MTENNVKNKMAFCAQYYGQEIFTLPNLLIKKKPFELKSISGLYLKPDLIEKIAEICNFSIPSRKISVTVDPSVITIRDSSEENSALLIYLETYAIVVIDYKGRRENPHAFQVLQISDMLKKEGYLLPYLDLSPKDILGYGWAKLKP